MCAHDPIVSQFTQLPSAAQQKLNDIGGGASSARKVPELAKSSSRDLLDAICAPTAQSRSTQNHERYDVQMAPVAMSMCTQPPKSQQLARVSRADCQENDATKVARQMHVGAMAMSPCTQMPGYLGLNVGWEKSLRSLVANQLPEGSGREDVNAGTALSPCTAPSQIFQEPVELLEVAALQVAEMEARRTLGWERLREFQKRAVKAWAAGRHCFLLSGTGSGKTGCFVLPALVARAWHRRQPGSAREPAPVALVVSPLVALMRDQVRRLRGRGVEAAVCSPQCDDPHAWRDAIQGRVEVLFMSPELLVQLANSGDLKRLPRVSLFAVDEAHCISEWGYHFRPEYGQLRSVMASIAEAGYGGREPPVICVTATCTADVRSDVLRSLSLEEASTELVMGTMNRPNLYFATEELSDGAKMQRRLLELFDAAAPGSDAAQARRDAPLDLASPSCYSPTIVYAQRRADCEQLARLLVAGGVRAAAFHACLDNTLKRRVQEEFLEGALQVVVATVAFGMGIDKSDVRRVLHFGLPSSLESYSQECGRSGRDGGLALCVVFFTPLDRGRREMAILGDASVVPSTGLHRSLARLQSVLRYCRDRCRCRRETLLVYLGEDACRSGQLVGSQPPPPAGTRGYCVHDDALGMARCAHCDVCCAPAASPQHDLACELDTLLRCAVTVDVRGSLSGRLQLAEECALSSEKTRLTRDGWQRLIDAAADAGLLEIRFMGPKSVVVYGVTTAGRRRAEKSTSEPFLVDLGAEAPMKRAPLQMPAWVPAAAVGREIPLASHLAAVCSDSGQSFRPSTGSASIAAQAAQRCAGLDQARDADTSLPQAAPPKSEHALTWFSSAVNWRRIPQPDKSGSCESFGDQSLQNVIDDFGQSPCHPIRLDQPPSPVPDQAQNQATDLLPDHVQALAYDLIDVPPESVPSQFLVECVPWNRQTFNPMDKFLAEGAEPSDHMRPPKLRRGVGDRPSRQLRRSGSSGQPPETVPSQGVPPKLLDAAEEACSNNAGNTEADQSMTRTLSLEIGAAVRPSRQLRRSGSSGQPPETLPSQGVPPRLLIPSHEACNHVVDDAGADQAVHCSISYGVVEDSPVISIDVRDHDHEAPRPQDSSGLQSFMSPPQMQSPHVCPLGTFGHPPEYVASQPEAQGVTHDSRKSMRPPDVDSWAQFPELIRNKENIRPRAYSNASQSRALETIVVPDDDSPPLEERDTGSCATQILVADSAVFSPTQARPEKRPRLSEVMQAWSRKRSVTIGAG